MFNTLKFKIALRNILRHRLRSLLSVIIIAGSIISIVVFRGFTQYSLGTVKKIASENQYGHLQIAKENYWRPGSETRLERLINLEDVKVLRNKFPSIEKVSGRLSFYGLASGSDVSVTGQFVGIDIDIEDQFSKSMKILSGKYFSSSDSDEVLIGNLIAQQINVKAGDTITVLNSTVDGVTNALDLKVSGVITAGIDEVDARIIYLPLKTAQSLLDTTLVDLAVIKFNDVKLADTLFSDMAMEAKKINSQLKPYTWRDLSLVFKQTKNFYKVQNAIVESIILMLMFLGIVNSVSMTIIERTGEIGTLRSLGETKRGIISQFILESLIISVFGVIAGILLSYATIQFVHWLNIITDIPGASTPFQIKVVFMYYAVIYAVVLTVTTTLIATFIPALHSTKMTVVDALRKNI